MNPLRIGEIGGVPRVHSVRSSVYVVQAQNGLVKIGRSNHVRSRCEAMACLSPVLVRLVAVWPGSLADEAELHQRFAADWSHGEWFHGTSPAVMEWLNEIWGKGLLAPPGWMVTGGARCAPAKELRAERQGRTRKISWTIPGLEAVG